MFSHHSADARLLRGWPFARRAWVAVALGAALTLPCVAAETAAAPRLEWSDVPAILARIKAPTFPARNFSITDHGAKGDGTTDSLPAVRAAIAACVAAGGGHVVVPAGTYLLNGPIHLQSNIDLHLEAGSTLLFSGRPADFLPVVLTRWEGVILYNYSPMIYARGAENVAVTGRGTIDGNARREFRSWAMDISKLQDRGQELSRRMARRARRSRSGGSARATSCGRACCKLTSVATCSSRA